MRKNSERVIKARYQPSKIEVYGWIGLIRLIINFIRTKLLIKSARLIRFPLDIRGKSHIDFGKNITVGKGCRFEAYPYLKRGKILNFGEDIEINDYVHITAVNKVSIGNNVLMASKIYISDTNHGSYKGDEYDSTPDSIARRRSVIGIPVTIEDNVWLGESVSVLSGVTIGTCSIIGANSVVTKNIPPYTIAAGNPARPIKKYDFEYRRWIRV
jgi:lipopolysaccharide O-acetyltransferase